MCLSPTTTPREAVATALTALFVPGDRPDRFSKAVTSGADLVIIDLEDAVAPAAKGKALSAVCEALMPGTETKLQALVRINARGSTTHGNEIKALAEIAAIEGHGLLGIMLAKAEDPDYVAHLRKRLPEQLALVLLVESAAGIVHANEMARVPGVSRLAFGAIDFALDIDSETEPVLDYAKAQLIIASRAASLPAPFDSPSIDIAEMEKVSESADEAKSFGFGGKLCIHPRQVEPVRNAFQPSPSQLQWARSVLQAEEGAAQVDGRMVDKPVRDRARRLLEVATGG